MVENVKVITNMNYNNFKWTCCLTSTSLFLVSAYKSNLTTLNLFEWKQLLTRSPPSLPRHLCIASWNASVFVCSHQLDCHHTEPVLRTKERERWNINTLKSFVNYCFGAEKFYHRNIFLAVLVKKCNTWFFSLPSRGKLCNILTRQWGKLGTIC